MNATDFNADIGRQQFLELLVAQLEHQDPLQPVDQQDFITQLAQFSVVDGVEKLNVRFDDLVKLQTLSQGADIVGRTVEFTSPLTGQTGAGRVDRAELTEGRLTLLVNGEQIGLEQIQAVLAEAPGAAG